MVLKEMTTITIPTTVTTIGAGAFSEMALKATIPQCY